MNHHRYLVAMFLVLRNRGRICLARQAPSDKPRDMPWKF